MALLGAVWRCMVIFLLNCRIRHYFLVSTSSLIIDNPCTGSITVKPRPPFPMGTNLTVVCQTEHTRCVSRFFLWLNDRLQAAPLKEDCTTGQFTLVDVRLANFSLTCRQEIEGVTSTICGQDLRTGYSPDKPSDISCQAPMASEEISCTWARGQDTHLPTTYTVLLRSKTFKILKELQIQGSGLFSIPRSGLDETEQYQLSITAQNHLGSSESDLFIFSVQDVVIPDTPQILNLEFGNDSRSATLRWNSSEPSGSLRSDVRIRTGNGFWVEREGTDLGRRLVMLEGFEPLTEYEFQIRVYIATPRPTSTPRPISTPRPTSTPRPISTPRPTSTPRPISTPRPASSLRPCCSRWSPSVWKTSPGTAPTRALDVWRVIRDTTENGLQEVKVLWKPLSPGDYSGEVVRYELVYLDEGQKHNVTCPVGVSQCHVSSVSPGVQVLTLRAVTAYGKSPPATIHLTHTGVSGPALRKLVPAEGGSALSVSWSRSWSWSGAGCNVTDRAGSGAALVGYVVEWRSGPLYLHWKRVTNNQNTTLITGLKWGVRYNVSLHAVTTRGVCEPSSAMTYSRELIPRSGPKVSVLALEARRVLVQWEEMTLDQQRGVITNYTLYLKRLDSGLHLDKVTLSVSAPRRQWLPCPEAAVTLCLSASTSAGEGPQGECVSLQHPGHAVGLVAGISLTATIVMAILANLMCWSCVRKRIKQTCISLGPFWLFGNLPKPENSNAVRLLNDNLEMQELGDPDVSWWLFTHDDDPPLSPIEEISQEERADHYPIIHIGELRGGTGERIGIGPSSLLADVSYKPQITTTAPQEEEEEKEEEEEREWRDVPVCEEMDRRHEVPGGLLRGLLCDVAVDFSAVSSGLTLSSIGDLTSPSCSTQITSPFSGDAWLREKGLEVVLEAGTGSLDLQQGQTGTSDEAVSCLETRAAEATLTSGYFRQLPFNQPMTEGEK